MIWSSRQGIWSAEILAWNVLKGKIEFGEVERPSGLPTIQIPRLAEVGQVFVISEDLDSGRGTQKIVSPSIKGPHNSK